jgi:hypothetical protein
LAQTVASRDRSATTGKLWQHLDWAASRYELGYPVRHMVAHRPLRQ